MANTNLNLVKFNGFGCYLTTVVSANPTILNDGAASTALPVYATGEALRLVSSSVEDGGSGGDTGALTVQVIYLDTDGSVDSETVTMNGTTNVNLTDTTVARVLDIHCMTFGSAGTNVGVITIQTTGGVNRMSIPIGHNRAAPGRFTIPTGYVGLYRGFNLSNGSMGTPTRLTTFIEADINPRTGNLNENVYQPIDFGVGGAASGVHGNFAAPEKGGRRVYLPEKTTIRARALSDVSAGCGVGGFVFVELYPKPTT